ncbi:MAG: class I SAM-dependent methyltransferase [Pseudomonadota bacterium]|nr:class I SAM-dependent methyltransferase [Pseudomonadota bacterium]
MADIGYTHGFYRELTPALLSLVALTRGQAGPALDQPLQICELGCGQGFSMNLLAAANPHCQFHATDFNPAQIAGAKALAGETGLSNVTFHDTAFAEFADKPGLPEAFDIIALHGIYSWISPENRAAIVDFIARKLKVGGLVYISYNALPGWASGMPLRRLFVDRAGSASGPIGPRIEDALAFAGRLKDVNAGFFRVNPGTGERLDRIKGQNRNYLAHEYFNRDWTPFYFADVAEELSAAKLSFVGSAALLESVDAINLTAEQQGLLAEIGDVAQRETVKDFIFNQQFRRDVFIKGPLPLSPCAAQSAWAEQRFALSTRREDVPLTVKGILGEANLQADVYGPLLDALANGPKTVRDLVSDPAIAALGWARLTQAFTVLVGSGHLQPCLPARDEAKRAKTTKAFNQAVVARAKDGADLQFLASPVTGGGVSLDRFQQLFLGALWEGKKTPTEWADATWQTVAAQGQRLVKEGKTLESAAENRAELTAQAEGFAEKRLPVLRSLGVV